MIDDDKTVTNLFSEVLTFMGLEVLAQGHSGEDAVTLYKKHCPDISFIDIMMPVTDGIYAIEKIRKLDPNSKIVVVTADSTTETKRKLDEFSIKAIVEKPFSQDQIKDTLKKEFNIKIGR